MSLGIFFPIGDSFEELEKQGKLSRLVNYYLPAYKKKFGKIYIFSYGGSEDFTLPAGCVLITNKWKIHRFIYTLLFPIAYFRILTKIRVIRVLQLSGIISALITKLFWGTKIVITYGYDYRRVEELTGHKYKAYAYWLIEKYLLPLCDKIIFSSRTIRSNFPMLAGKAIYIPNGIDLGKFKPTRIKRPSHKFLIVTQSRLSREKNLDLLIRAVSRVKAKNIRLIIIGTGPLKKELVQTAQKCGIDLQILEKVPNDEMPQQYQHADVYVHPSFTEGSSKSLIEAAACGCCILASDIPQNREVLDDAAVYCKPELDDLKEKLQNLYDCKALRISLRGKVSLKVISRFDINLFLPKESEMLEQLSV